MFKDWLLDLSATVTAIFIGGAVLMLVKGKAHHWGKKMHGHNPDGSKGESKKSDTEDFETV